MLTTRPRTYELWAGWTDTIRCIVTVYFLSYHQSSETPNNAMTTKNSPKWNCNNKTRGTKRWPQDYTALQGSWQGESRGWGRKRYRLSYRHKTTMRDNVASQPYELINPNRFFVEQAVRGWPESHLGLGEPVSALMGLANARICRRINTGHVKYWRYLVGVLHSQRKSLRCYTIYPPPTQPPRRRGNFLFIAVVTAEFAFIFLVIDEERLWDFLPPCQWIVCHILHETISSIRCEIVYPVSGGRCANKGANCDRNLSECHYILTLSDSLNRTNSIRLPFFYSASELIHLQGSLFSIPWKV